jgi:hypothetical protein
MCGLASSSPASGLPPATPARLGFTLRVDGQDTGDTGVPRGLPPIVCLCSLPVHYVTNLNPWWTRRRMPPRRISTVEKEGRMPEGARLALTEQMWRLKQMIDAVRRS